MYVSKFLLFFAHLRRRKLNYDAVSLNYDVVNELQRRKLIYDVVMLIYAIAHIYVYLCACSTVTFVVLGIANLVISFLREGEMHFLEEFIKRYFWKGYKYDEINLSLEKRHHVQISKGSFQRYANQLELFRKNLLINSVSLLEDVQQYLEENGSSHGYRKVQQRLMSRGMQYSKKAVRIALMLSIKRDFLEGKLTD